MPRVTPTASVSVVAVAGTVGATGPGADYTAGLAALDRGDYTGAVAFLSRAQGVSGAAPALAYAQGAVALAGEAYDEAVRTFAAAGDFRDAPRLLDDARTLALEQGAYTAGERAIARGDLVEAIRQFATAGDYHDAPARLAQVQDEQTLRLRYGDAQALLQTRRYAEAYAVLDEINRFRPNYRDVPALLANLTGEVLPVTLDLRSLAAGKDAAYLAPVLNLIGRPVGYLRLSPVGTPGATGAVGAVRVEFVSNTEPNASRLNSVTPVFLAADEPDARAGVRPGETVAVATAGAIRQVAGFGPYTATFTVREATTRAAVFTALVVDVALRR